MNNSTILFSAKSGSIFIYCLILIFSCSPNTETNTDNFVNRNSTKQIRIESLSMKSLKINLPNESSGTGFFRTGGETIYFLDEIAYKVYQLNSENDSLTLVLDQGSGPKEIPRFQDYLFHNNQHYFFDGWTVYEFNTNWKRKRSFVIDFDVQKSMDELVNNPAPTDRGIYEVKYFGNQWRGTDSNNIFFNIETSHPQLNAYDSEEYYKNSRIMAKLDLKSGKVVDLVGKKSSAYLGKKFLPSFDFHHYHFTNDSFYLNFEVDELIYVYDKNFNPAYSFGLEGKQMNNNYFATNDINVASDKNKFIKDRRDFGYYSSIFHSTSENLTFRTYSTGKINEAPASNRMQIYEGFTLVGDVEVPNGFEIINYKVPYFYAQKRNEEEEMPLEIIKFEIPK